MGSGSSLLPLRHTKWGYVAASLFFSLCSMLGKEQGVMVIGVCACFDLALNWEPFWGEFFNLFRTKIKGAVKKRSERSSYGNGSGDRQGEQLVSLAVETQGQIDNAEEDQNGVRCALITNGYPPPGVESVGSKLNSKVAKSSASSSLRDQFCGDHFLLKEMTLRISKSASRYI